MSETFNVVQFFPDDSYEYLRRYVPVEEAMQVAKSYMNRPAAMLGIIRRIIITDGGDCIVFEWQCDKGITWPENMQ